MLNTFFSLITSCQSSFVMSLREEQSSGKSEVSEMRMSQKTALQPAKCTTYFWKNSLSASIELRLILL